MADMFVTANCLISMQDSMYPCTCKVSLNIRKHIKYFCHNELAFDTHFNNSSQHYITKYFEEI